MWKEVIICVVIVIAVSVGNVITQNYTKDTVHELTQKLGELREELVIKHTENKFDDKVKSKISKVKEEWEKKHDKLAYYIEHDELEKVEKDLTGIESFIETEEYSEIINDLDECVFLLNHIQEKYAFSLENVF